MKRTRGISAKLLAPVQGSMAALAYNWITTGVFDRGSAGLAAVAVLGLVFGYFTRADDVVDASKDDLHTPSDDAQVDVKPTNGVEVI